VSALRRRRRLIKRCRRYRSSRQRFIAAEGREAQLTSTGRQCLYIIWLKLTSLIPIFSVAPWWPQPICLGRSANRLPLPVGSWSSSYRRMIEDVSQRSRDWSHNTHKTYRTCRIDAVSSGAPRSAAAAAVRSFFDRRCSIDEKRWTEWCSLPSCVRADMFGGRLVAVGLLLNGTIAVVSGG